MSGFEVIGAIAAGSTIVAALKMVNPQENFRDPKGLALIEKIKFCSWFHFSIL
jgi:hypothetical protein